MTLLSKTVSTAILVILLLPFTASTADAQVTFLSRSGQDSYFAAGTHGYRPDFTPRRLIRDPDRAYDRSVYIVDEDDPVWRETRYYEYRPTRVIQHGAHDHVIPGRYHYHSSGQWD